MTRRQFIYKWIESLESGEYKQGRFTLAINIRDSGEVLHCCLGVVCDLGVKLKLIEVDKSYSVFMFDGETKTLPRSMKNMLGFNTGDGYFNSLKSLELSLSYLNDNTRYSFSQIADIIKYNLENGNPNGLFKEDIDFDEEIITELQVKE